MDLTSTKTSISFSGCGFLGIYHVGVASCLKEYAPHLYKDKIIGASAGALVSTALLSGCCLGECTTFTLKLSMDARSRSLGPLSPRFALVSNLRKALNDFLPDDAHKHVSGKLYISLTRVSDNKNVLASDFQCKEDLIDCLICSSFVPFYSGIFPPKFKGVHYIDGGLTDNLPVFDQQTITISPFAGESDICPDDSSYCPHNINLAGLNVQVTANNIYRASVAFFPPAPEVLSDMCRRGFADALRFLKKNKLIHCQRHVSIHSALVSLKTLDHMMGQVGEEAEDIGGRNRGNVKHLVATAKQERSFCQLPSGEKDSKAIMDEFENQHEAENYRAFEDEDFEEANIDDDDDDDDVADDDDDDDVECDECLKMGYEAFKDLPPMAVQQALQAALDEDKRGYLSSLYRWRAFHFTSLMITPYTFPFEVSLMIGRKLFNWAPNLYNDAHWFFIGLYNLFKNFLHLHHDDTSASELTTWFSSYGHYLGLFRGQISSNSRKRSFISMDATDFQLEDSKKSVDYSAGVTTKPIKDCRHRKGAYTRLKNANLRTISIREEDENVDKKDNFHVTIDDSHQVPSTKIHQTEKMHYPSAYTDVDSFEYALEVTEQMDAILSYYYLDSNNKINIVEIFPPNK